MRSQNLFRRSRSLLKASSAYTNSPRFEQLSVRSTLRCARRETPSSLPTSSRISRRLVSSAQPDAEGSSAAAGSPSDGPESPEAPIPPAEEPELKPRRRASSVSTSYKDLTLPLPRELDILWKPGDVEKMDAEAHAAALPPPELLEEALNNLHIAMHPQTQHRATYSTTSEPLIEPTLALCCPIEGGDYIIDATIRELAHRTGSEVIVVDAVQLSAGEWGHFSLAASQFHLPRNPLHFPSYHPPSSRSARVNSSVDEDEDDRWSMVPQPISVHVMTPSRAGLRVFSSSNKNDNSPSKFKAFFQQLLNIPSDPNDPPGSSTGQPRILYIRDFPTLAPSSATWYGPLLTAVRQHRQGPVSRPSSPVVNPTTVIFGMTPPLTSSTSQAPNSAGMMNILMSRNSTSSPSSHVTRPMYSDWSEDEISEKAREKRLRDRLRKWEKSETLLIDEFPPLLAGDESSSSEDSPRIRAIGSDSALTSLPAPIASLFGQMDGSQRGSDNSEASSRFYRTSILVPSTRQPDRERENRMSRRREINELTMRMAVGAIGGQMEIGGCFPPEELENQPSTTDMASSEAHSNKTTMWNDWGNHIEPWNGVRHIADRALGSVIASQRAQQQEASLIPTLIFWEAVYDAWSTQKSASDIRKSWSKKVTVHVLPEDAAEGESQEETVEDTTDELIERIKSDPELDQHESRLLSCIVDSRTMPTSFGQVHLPPHTIDSVRTIVSLPLLHPSAFQQGVLKEHGMTGCLLFGPPGTGKTLVVRALAKEAGCRMLTISPSDVMDMYVGEGEKLVKAVFSLARRLSPCVVFIDEIDALFGARMSSRESGGAFAHRGVITEFMQEMDGLKSSKDDRVVVIGATNRPFDLDDAVLRRLPRRLLVDLPGEKEREEILKILLRDEVLDDDLDLQKLAKSTESFSGSDLKHLCVSAALDAVKERVDVPWKVSSSASSDTSSTPDQNASHSSQSTNEQTSVPSLTAAAETYAPSTSEPSEQPSTQRTLSLRHFTKALKEITPSSSESLGSLAELRRWNDEFGEGRKDKRKKQVWGKGNFGFIQEDKSKAEGKVATSGFESR